MRNLFTQQYQRLGLSFVFAFCMLFTTVFAQTTVTVSTAAGNSEQVYYSFANGVVKTLPNAGWDIAFQINSFQSSILVNHVEEVILYNSGQDISGWSTIDANWVPVTVEQYNSDTSWSYGAFNNPPSANPVDLGWGEYNTTTHVVSGDSVYVVEFSGGARKKLIVNQLQSGTYTFTYANLDGTDSTTATIAKSDYADRNFAYYSLQGDSASNREPDNTTWDLVFTKYFAYFPMQQVYYGTTGALSNASMGVKTAEANGVDVNTVTSQGQTFTTNISEIGYDWKRFDFQSGSYIIADSTAYFIQALDGNVYKIYFTAFGGSTTGDISFVVDSEITNRDRDLLGRDAVTLFPNPTDNQFTVRYQWPNTEQLSGRLVNAMGQAILINETLNAGKGEVVTPVQNLPAGMYHWILTSPSYQSITPVMIY